MRHIYRYILVVKLPHITKIDPKLKRLRELGVLNPHASAVRAAWYGANEFFDANDVVQTKYEMLRHVKTDGATKVQAAALFGLSRPTLYQAEAAFAHSGLAGLMPKQRGPKGANKLTDPVIAFIEQRVQHGGPIQARAMAQAIKSQLGLSVHPRSIERALARKKKR